MKKYGKKPLTEREKKSLEYKKSKLDFGGLWGSRVRDYCEHFVNKHKKGFQVPDEHCQRLARYTYEHYKDFAKMGFEGMINQMLGSMLKMESGTEEPNKNAPGNGKFTKQAEEEPFYSAGLRTAVVQAYNHVERVFNKTHQAEDEIERCRAEDVEMRNTAMGWLLQMQQEQINEYTERMWFDHTAVGSSHDYKLMQFTYRPIPSESVWPRNYDDAGNPEGPFANQEGMEDLTEALRERANKGM